MPRNGRHGRRVDGQAVLAAEQAREPVGQGRQADGEGERGAGQVRAVQAAGGDPDRDPDQRRDQRRGEHGRKQSPAVADEQHHRVGADRHERAVAERDLARQPDQDGQSGERREVVRALRELEILVGAEHVGDQDEQDTEPDDQAERARQGEAPERAARKAAGQRAHTRRSLVAGNSPVGRIISTSTSTTKAAIGTSAVPS